LPARDAQVVHFDGSKIAMLVVSQSFCRGRLLRKTPEFWLFFEV
jgi:hypothetical protein